jgi:hypothetical protein
LLRGENISKEEGRFFKAPKSGTVFVVMLLYQLCKVYFGSTVQERENIDDKSKNKNVATNL